jgi:hypothetical protein
MTSSTLTENPQVIEGQDWEGKRETTTVYVVRNHESGEWEVSVRVDGDETDFYSFEEESEALELARDLADGARDEYREREQERLQSQREERKEALLDLARDSEVQFDGDDKAAVQALARLIGKGKGGAALAALKALAK